MNLRLDSDKKANLAYIMTMILYYGVYAFIFLYLSVYMLANGFENSEIGVVMAIGFACTVVVQQVLANFADKSRLISSSQIQAAGFIIVIAVNIGLMCMHGRNMLICVLYCLQIIIVMGIQPCLNALNFQMLGAGYKMNFGFARSLGCVSYGVVSAICGYLISFFGNAFLQVGTIFLSICAITLLFVIDVKLRRKEKTLPAEKSVNADVQQVSYVDFIKQYRAFMIFIGGSTFLFFSFAILNNFMYQVMEPLGCTKSDYGIVQGLKGGIEVFPMVLSLALVMRFGIRKLIIVSCFGFFVKAFLTMIAGSLAGIYFATMFETTAYGLFAPVTIYYVAELFDKKDAVKGQSLLTLAYALGCVLASASGGAVLNAFGPHILLIVATLAAAIGTGINIFALPIIDKKIEKKNRMFD